MGLLNRVFSAQFGGKPEVIKVDYFRVSFMRYFIMSGTHFKTSTHSHCLEFPACSIFKCSYFISLNLGEVGKFTISLFTQSKLLAAIANLKKEGS